MKFIGLAIIVLLVQQGGFSQVQTLEKNAESSLNFLILGDWGGQDDYPYTTPAEVALAKVMGAKASEIGSQFTLALGDNFYHNGVKDVFDKRFNATFEVRIIIIYYIL